MSDPRFEPDLALLAPELIRLRRDLHRHPELSFAEERTAERVFDRLRSLGMTVRRGVGGTGVVADLEGELPGQTLLLRADMDALPIVERTTHDFPSVVPGVAHACGHDAHVAALLGTATLLAERRRALAGRVRFVFQPAEEVFGGARAMLSEGILEGVDAALAAHVFSSAPFGQVVCRPGPMMSGGDLLELRVLGRAGHGGSPHTSVDPLYAAAQLLVALQSIVARETRPGEPLVVSMASIQAGTAPNVTVEDVIVRGSVRWFDRAERDRALARIADIGNGVCAALRTSFELEVIGSAPVTTNSPAVFETVCKAVDATGRAAVIDLGPRTASEDFALIAEEVPSCFLGIGCGGEGATPHHHPAFDLDERAIGLSAEVMARAALSFLGPDRA